MRIGQKVKEHSATSIVEILPMFLPIAQARGAGQVRGVHPRAKTLREVAERSDSLEDFGRHLRDWLHELRRVSTRRQAEAVIAEEPLRLGEKFPLGHIADAWLAAYAEHVAGKVRGTPPEWAFASWRIAEDPIFDEGSTPALRMLALIHSPLAFKRRNIFTPSVDLPLALRAHSAGPNRPRN